MDFFKAKESGREIRWYSEKTPNTCGLNWLRCRAMFGWHLIRGRDSSGDLDHKDDTDEGYVYTVFGQVVEGEAAAKKINWKVVKPRGGFAELPSENMRILTARRFE